MVSHLNDNTIKIEIIKRHSTCHWVKTYRSVGGLTISGLEPTLNNLLRHISENKWRNLVEDWQHSSEWQCSSAQPGVLRGQLYGQLSRWEWEALDLLEALLLTEPSAHTGQVVKFVSPTRAAFCRVASRPARRWWYIGSTWTPLKVGRSWHRGPRSKFRGEKETDSCPLVNTTCSSIGNRGTRSCSLHNPS